MFPSEEPTAKRAKTERKLLKNCPAPEFLELSKKLFSGPEVIVMVKGKAFQVPKALLCYNSQYFEAALDEELKEEMSDMAEDVKKRTIELDMATEEGFELVLQWMYTSNIILSSKQALKVRPGEAGDTECDSSVKSCDAVEDDNAWKIDIYLNFLKLADQIGLLGPFDNVVNGLKGVLIYDRNSLRPEHIRSAAQLPAGHAIRILFAEACVKPYIHHVSPDSDLRDRIHFTLENEVDEVEGFAADLFREFGKTFIKRSVFKKIGKGNILAFTDPLTDEKFRI